MIHRLGQDPVYASFVTPEAIVRNQHLVATLDALSLAICMGVTEQRQFEQVPTVTGETTVTLTPIDHDPTQLSLEPWCFQVNEVTVIFEGRILRKKTTDEQDMRDQLSHAPWITLTVTLRP